MWRTPRQKKQVNYSIVGISQFASSQVKATLRTLAMRLIQPEIEKLKAYPWPEPFSYKGASFYDQGKLFPGGHTRITLDDCPFDVTPVNWDIFLDKHFPEEKKALADLTNNLDFLNRDIFSHSYFNRTQLTIEYPWVTKYCKIALSSKEAKGYSKLIPKEDSDRLYELLQYAIFNAGENCEYEYILYKNLFQPRRN